MTLFLLPYAVLAQESSLDPSVYDEDGFRLDNPKYPTATPQQEADAAKDNAQIPVSSLNPSDVVSGEFASCFDYYAFGSVGINLTTDFGSYKEGGSVKITGPITNNNSYPVVGLDIKARLVKDIPDSDSSRSEIIVLDEFDVADNITLDAGASYNVSYPFNLPMNSPSGQYQLYFYAVEQKRFNLSGLSFTNDIVGSRISFDVTGETPDHVYLDQTQILVGDQPHNVMAFMTRHGSDASIPVTIPLYNSDDSEKQMNVTYSLYSWDSANPENKIETKMEQVTVPTKSEVKLTYMIDKPNLPVYYLSITAEPTDQEKDTSVFSEKTMSNVRLVITDESKTRLNYVGVNQYPLRKGTEATFVTCFHNTSSLESPEARVVSIMYDSRHKEIARVEYKGKTNPDITGLIQKFNPKGDMSEFTIESTLYDEKGEIIDQVEKKYSCQDINPDSCVVETQNSFLFIALSILVIIGLIVLVYKRKTINLIRV